MVVVAIQVVDKKGFAMNQIQKKVLRENKRTLASQGG